MLEKVVALASRHQMFAAGDRIAVAVSGGADSVCLLHVLLELRSRWNLELSVAHLDHQLRAESAADAEFVRHLAAQHGLAFFLERADLTLPGNLEQQAREARLRFFRRLVADGLAGKVATGHTKSDQAETVLFRFLRGAGTAGLAGILPVTADGLVRPLLAVTRAEAEAWLRERGIRWCDDPTNRSLAFTRNRIRLELLPLLEREYNPSVMEQLTQTSEIAREEEAYWRGKIDELAGRLFQHKRAALVLHAGELSALDRSVARRLIRRAIEEIRGDLRKIEFQHVELVLGLAARAQGDGRVQIPGVDVFRSFDWIRLSRLGLAAGNRLVSEPLVVPGTTRIEGGRVVIETGIQEATEAGGLCDESGYNEVEATKSKWAVLAWDRAAEPLTLRYWLPGDSYRPAGAERAEKLKQMFQLARVPLWERRFWPIIEGSQGILWTRQFGVSADLLPTRTTSRFLLVREMCENS
ncbi:MAG: tRNA lysidine(34) synthetase TilS [Acidobacteria bacterium]|nr:tRNA lysidine(34) synthetase TilS [Acidobacteriota bacterium]